MQRSGWALIGQAAVDATARGAASGCCWLSVGRAAGRTSASVSVGRGPAGWGRGGQRGPLGARGTAVQVSDPSSDPAPDPASAGTAPGLGQAGRPGPRAGCREVGPVEPEPSDPRPATRPRPTPTRPLPGGLGPGVPAPRRLGKKVGGGRRRGRRAWVGWSPGNCGSGAGPAAAPGSRVWGEPRRPGACQSVSRQGSSRVGSPGKGACI